MDLDVGRLGPNLTGKGGHVTLILLIGVNVLDDADAWLEFLHILVESPGRPWVVKLGVGEGMGRNDRTRRVYRLYRNGRP
jgi:hypothetical protein